MSNRILIDALSGIIELEGEKEFVEAQLDKLLPLIESCGFGASAEFTEDATGSDEAVADVTTSTAADTKGKRTKRSVNRPPKGHSCPDRMMTLRGDGFFEEQRTPGQIVEGLAKKGWTHNSSQVSAAGGQMFKRGDIQRTKVGKGFAYFWDRE